MGLQIIGCCGTGDEGGDCILHVTFMREQKLGSFRGKTNHLKQQTSSWVMAWLRGYRIGVQEARLSQMLRASATARMSHAPEGHWDHCTSICLRDHINHGTALLCTVTTLICSNEHQESSRNDCKTFQWSHRALLRRNIAFPKCLRCELNNHC